MTNDYAVLSRGPAGLDNSEATLTLAMRQSRVRVPQRRQMWQLRYASPSRIHRQRLTKCHSPPLPPLSAVTALPLLHRRRHMFSCLRRSKSASAVKCARPPPSTKRPHVAPTTSRHYNPQPGGRLQNRPQQPTHRDISHSLQHKVVVCGNPGVGKSTILSTLLSRSAFPSGTSLGRGFTSRFRVQPVHISGVTYNLVDTPGLEDVGGRANAAHQISAALAGPSILHLVFVVTLESGRVRPPDVATVSAVLTALREQSVPVSNCFSLIFNKLEASTYEHLLRDNRNLSSYLEPFRKVAKISVENTLALTIEYESMGADNSILSSDARNRLHTFISRSPTIKTGAGFHPRVDPLSDEEKALEMERERERLIAIRDGTPSQQQHAQNFGRLKRASKLLPMDVAIEPDGSSWRNRYQDSRDDESRRSSLDSNTYTAPQRPLYVLF